MPETIQPAYYHFPDEMDVVGRLLAGYGELEFELCLCVNAVKKDLDGSIKTLFSVRGEKRRIEEAEKLIQATYNSSKLANTFADTISDMHWCREIRNQYSHCHWYPISDDKLYFVNLEEIAKSSMAIREIKDWTKPITLSVLKQQEFFFLYVRKCFWFLAAEMAHHLGGPHNRLYPSPHKVQRPPLYC